MTLSALLKDYNGVSVPGVVDSAASVGQAGYVREQCRVAARWAVMNGGSGRTSVSEMQ